MCGSRQCCTTRSFGGGFSRPHRVHTTMRTSENRRDTMRDRKPLCTRPCRRSGLVLWGHDRFPRNLHTAEVTGSIPVSPTDGNPCGCRSGSLRLGLREKHRNRLERAALRSGAGSTTEIRGQPRSASTTPSKSSTSSDPNAATATNATTAMSETSSPHSTNSAPDSSAASVLNTPVEPMVSVEEDLCLRIIVVPSPSGCRTTKSSSQVALNQTGAVGCTPLSVRRLVEVVVHTR